MALPNLPRAQAPLTLGGDRPTNEWRRFFERLAGVDSVEGVQEEIDALNARLRELEDAGYLPSDFAFRGPMSVRIVGSTAGGALSFQLVGDLTNPDPTMYYGTGAEGDKGWWLLDVAALADVDLTTPPTDGQALLFDIASQTWIPGDAGGGSGNLDGGHADTNYGGTTAIDGGSA